MLAQNSTEMFRSKTSSRLVNCVHDEIHVSTSAVINYVAMKWCWNEMRVGRKIDAFLVWNVSYRSASASELRVISCLDPRSAIIWRSNFSWMCFYHFLVSMRATPSSMQREACNGNKFIVSDAGFVLNKCCSLFTLKLGLGIDTKAKKRFLLHIKRGLKFTRIVFLYKQSVAWWFSLFDHFQINLLVPICQNSQLIRSLKCELSHVFSSLAHIV